MEPSAMEKVVARLLDDGVGLLQNVAIFAVILLVSYFVIKSVCGMMDKALDKVDRVNATLQKFLVNVVGKILWVVALMLALPRLGVNIAPLVAGLGVTGFIFGFAFQDSLSNLASGIMILLNDPYRIGDFIEAAGHTGKVVELNMMSTTLATPDNKKIVIPNKSIWGGPITNYTANDTRRVDLTFAISYGSDISKARQVIQAVIAANSLVLKDPEPVVELVELAGSSLNFVVRPWAKTVDYWTVYFQLNQQIKEALDAAGIVIPFPQMVVHQAR